MQLIDVDRSENCPMPVVSLVELLSAQQRDLLMSSRQCQQLLDSR